MDRTRIRWSKLGRLAAGLIGAVALIAVVPGLLAAPELPPLADDVGLTGGATGAYAYAPVGPGPRYGPDRRRSAPRAADEPPLPAHYRRPEPEPSPQRPDPGRSPTPAVIAAPAPPPATAAPPPAPPPATAAPPPAAPPTSPEPPDPPPAPAPPAEPDGSDPPPAPSQFGFER